jgi:hypothetical protein
VSARSTKVRETFSIRLVNSKGLSVKTTQTANFAK